MSSTWAALIPIIAIVMLFAALSLAGYLQERKDRAMGMSSTASPPDIDWDAIRDPEIQEALDAGKKINAIKRYRELTGMGLKEAKDAIEYAEANPALKGKKQRPAQADYDAGIRDLVLEGRLDEAAEVYRKFAGVDEYAARVAIAQIIQEIDEEQRSDHA